MTARGLLVDGCGLQGCGEDCPAVGWDRRASVDIDLLVAFEPGSHRFDIGRNSHVLPTSGLASFPLAQEPPQRLDDIMLIGSRGEILPRPEEVQSIRSCRRPRLVHDLKPRRTPIIYD